MMGTAITRYKFNIAGDAGLPRPLIYCFSDAKLNSEAFSLNLPIASELLKVRPARRSFKLPDVVGAVLRGLPDECTVKDFDVLFNPDYQVDVLQLLATSCRKKPFSILWPGDCVNGKLTYSQAGYPDFKQYDIKKYDVTCIV